MFHTNTLHCLATLKGSFMGIWPINYQERNNHGVQDTNNQVRWLEIYHCFSSEKFLIAFILD